MLLRSKTVGNYNTTDGLNALANNNTGGANTATGVSALFSDTALLANITGSNNQARHCRSRDPNSA